MEFKSAENPCVLFNLLLIMKGSSVMGVFSTLFSKKEEVSKDELIGLLKKQLRIDTSSLISVDKNRSLYSIRIDRIIGKGKELEANMNGLFLLFDTYSHKIYICKQKDNKIKSKDGSFEFDFNVSELKSIQTSSILNQNFDLIDLV